MEIENPFEKIYLKLGELENLVLNVANNTSRLLNVAEDSEPKIVDLDGLVKARPFIGSRSTIYKKVSAGLIPHSKRGKRLIFDLKVIDEWLLSNKIKTVADLEQDLDNYLNRKK